jgi:DedD protein
VDGKLKQRVVGVIVLTAIAIIVVPVLLDGTDEERQRIVQSVPDSPTLEVLDVSSQDIMDQMDRIEADSRANLPPEIEDQADIEPLESTLDPKGLPRAWSLQVASFVGEDNATQLRTDLRKNGFKSYVLKVSTETGERYRVLIGPHLQREKLEKIKVQIDAKYQLQGRIIRYDIKDDVYLLGSRDQRRLPDTLA